MFIKIIMDKDILSQKQIMLCALIINMEQWKMQLVLLTLIPLCALKNICLFHNLHSSVLLFNMSWLICGSETQLQCNGGMIFGLMRALQQHFLIMLAHLVDLMLMNLRMKHGFILQATKDGDYLMICSHQTIISKLLVRAQMSLNL